MKIRMLALLEAMNGSPEGGIEGRQCGIALKNKWLENECGNRNP